MSDKETLFHSFFRLIRYTAHGTELESLDEEKGYFHARHAKLLEILFSMGLPRAIKAHSDKKFVEAEQEYRRAYDQGQVNEIFSRTFLLCLGSRVK